MLSINAEQWGSDEHMMNPTRSEVNVDSFTETDKICKKRALLECERTFFNNETEITLSEINAEFCMNSSDRERATLVLDKRVYWSRSAFDNVLE